MGWQIANNYIGCDTVLELEIKKPQGLAAAVYPNG
jgi:hypothetical protein